MAFSDFGQNWKQEKRVQLERCTRFNSGKIVFQYLSVLTALFTIW